LDFTIIWPIIKAIWGYDPIIGEDLSEYERFLGLAMAVVDAACIAAAIATAGAGAAAGAAGRAMIMAAVREVLINAVATGAALLTYDLAMAMGLPPWAATLISLGIGIGINVVGTKYMITRNGEQIGDLIDMPAGGKTNQIEIPTGVKPGQGDSIGQSLGTLPEPPKVGSTVETIAPGPRTVFGGQDLAPNTHYHVEGRGDFYTDVNGKVTFVETQYGSKGALNWDLTHPQPDTTYVVHGNDGVTHVFTTNDQGQTTVAWTDNYKFAEAERSEAVQSRVGDLGGSDYDGGHIFANFSGGGPEDINMTAMHSSVNRSGGAYYKWESEMRAILENDPNARIEVRVESHFSTNPDVPDSFTVQYRVDGGPIKIEEIENGPI